LQHPNPQACAPDRLADHRPFLVRLARAMTVDENTADDLVQDTWLAALERRIAPSRALLARILRNRWSNVLKLDGRRRAREREVARPEAQVAPRTQEELEVEQRVLLAVHALPEPQRSAIWLRYWHDMSPERIARETDSRLETVRSRLARGRALLRERLGRELGDGRGFALLLGLASQDLGGPPSSTVVPSAATPWIGAFGMGAIGKVLTAAAVLVTCVYLTHRTTTDEAGPPRSPLVLDDQGQASLLVEPNPLRTADRTPLRAAPRDEADVHPVEPDAEPIAMNTFTGRVLDDGVRGVPDVELVLVTRGSDHAATTRTGPEGEFSLEATGSGGELSVRDDDWVTIGPAMTSRRESLVLVARRVPLGGTVVDHAGTPLAGARLSIELPAGFHSRYPFILDSTLTRPSVAASGTDGRFSFADATRVAGSLLLCERDGFVPRRLALDQVGSEVSIALQRLGEARDTLGGWVVDATGRPVGGATVSFGAERTSTEADGHFALPLASEVRRYARLKEVIGGESSSVSALAPGHLPGHADVELDAQGRPLWPDGVVIVLGGPPLSIGGLVVDARGAPIPNAMIWLDGLEVFSMEDGGVSHESLLAGSTARHLEFRSDADGRYEIPGLLERDYVVVALDPATDVTGRTESVPAGSRDVRIEIDTQAVHAVVAGRVLDLEGVPVAGVDVLVMTDANEMRFQGRFVRNSNLMVRRTTSDADGRFRLASVPREQVYLQVFGDDVEMTSFPLVELRGDDVENLELHCPRRVHVRVTIDVEGEADELAILDDQGLPLGLRVYRGKPGPVMTRAPIHGQVSDTLSVAQSGRTLVLYRGGVQVERRRIWLASGELNEL
jgi:RNA polymerase sigma factor (sigma-70 family)